MCDKSVVLQHPPQLQELRDGDDVSIDLCIAPTIQSLWSLGVVTLGCCCGHGKTAPSVVVQGMEPADVLALIGATDPRPWQVLTWSDDEDILTPWITAWAECRACGHWWANVRPLVVATSAGECPSCGLMEGVDNGPVWLTANKEHTGGEDVR